MPGSRAGQAATSKEPPRLPKPGESIPPPASPTPSPTRSMPAAPAAPAVAPPLPLPATPVAATVKPMGVLPLHPVPAHNPFPPNVLAADFTPAPAAVPVAEEPARAARPVVLRQNQPIVRRFSHLFTVAGAALVCSAAVAAWRVWPASYYFADLAEPDPELLYHYQPAPATAPEPGPAQSPDLFEEFAVEGFHFTPPADYWERIGGAASPFALLQPAFTLRRTESSPPSDFGVGACDFAVSTALLPTGTGVDDTWETLPAVLAVQARFSCGLPERYEVKTGGKQPLRCLRLVWETLPGGGGETPRHLEMWIHQRGRIAWSMTGLMPGSTASYALTRTMQRLTNGFSLLPLDSEIVRASLVGRELQGAAPLHSAPAPQSLYRWAGFPAGATSWPGGRLQAPGADGHWAVGSSRLALVCLPPDGFQKVTASRLLTGLRQIWPMLRGVSIPVIDPADAAPGKTYRLTLQGTFEGAPSRCALQLRSSPQGTVIAVGFQPEAANGQARDPAALFEKLDLTPQPNSDQATVQVPSTLHLPLLENLAIEAHADGRPREAADFHLALFNRSQRLEDLASACGSLASAGQVEEATRLFDAGGERFAHTPGWEIYRTLVLARLGAGARAHRHALDLLSSQRFPGSLAAPYLDALIESRSWPQAKAFASMLVRTDPASAVWRLHYASILAETGERAKAVAIIHATQQTWPEDAMLGIECVQTLIRLKNLQDASTLAARVALAHPGHEQAQLIFGQCQTLLGRPEEARLAYQRALKAAPASHAARTALTALAVASAQSDSAFISQAIDPVPLPAALASGLPPTPSEVHTPALVLSRITGYRHQRGRLPATTVRSRVLINNPEGMSQWNILTFSIDPARERIGLHYLNVLDTNGKVLARASLQDRYTLDAPDGGKIIHFPVPGLAPGCVIDYAVTTENLVPATTWPFTRHPFALPQPCLADICYVTGDTASLTWRHSTRQEPVRSGDALIWQNLQPLLLTSSTASSPTTATLYLGTVTDSWESVGRHYLEQIRHRLAADNTIKAAAARFTRDLPDKAAKIAALARRVRSDISYTSIEFGYRAIIPHTAAVTLQNRFGDCKDHAVLLHSLLEAAGIPSYLALIHSTTPVHPDFPALSQFDHMIVALPTTNGRFDFIDATDKFLEPTPGTSPLGLAGHHALILDPVRPRLADTPDAMAPSEGTLQRLISIQNEQDALMNDRLSITGPAAAGLRAQLAATPAGNQIPLLSRLLGLDRMRDQLIDVNFTALRDPSQPLEARIVWQSRNVVRPGPNGLQLTLSTPITDYLLFPPSLTDQISTGTASIVAPIRLQTTAILEAPSGYTVQPPFCAEARGNRPYGAWESSTTGNTLTWNAELRAGKWTGSEAADCARFPSQAVLPLRQPWGLSRGSFVSTTPVTEKTPASNAEPHLTNPAAPLPSAPSRPPGL